MSHEPTKEELAAVMALNTDASLTTKLTAANALRDRAWQERVEKVERERDGLNNVYAAMIEAAQAAERQRDEAKARATAAEARAEAAERALADARRAALLEAAKLAEVEAAKFGTLCVGSAIRALASASPGEPNE